MIQLITETFEENGAKITVQKPNGFVQSRLWRLQQLLKDYGSEDIDPDDAITLTHYLAHTVEIEGSIGFPVPLKNVTHPELIAFIRGLGLASTSLIQKWDKAIDTAAGLSMGNDPELLPPEEVSQKKETTAASSSSESSNAA